MSNRIKTNIFAFLTVLLWGSGFPFTRIIDNQISSLPLAAIRCAVSAIVLIIIGRICHIRLPFQKKDLVWFFFSGILGFSAYFIFFNLGLETLTSATGSIVTTAAPILSAIMVCKLYGERINIVGWISIACAFAGVLILLLWSGILSINIGVVWMFLAAAIFAGYNVLNRVFSNKGYTAMEVVTYSSIFGAIQMLPFLPRGISQLADANTLAILSAVYLGIMPGAVAYYFWSRALTHADRISEVTNYLFVNPLIAAIIGFLLLKEIPDVGTFLGGAIIIASVIVFSIKGSPKSQE